MARSILCGKVVVVCAAVVVMSGWVGSAGVFADATSEIEEAKAEIRALLKSGEYEQAQSSIESLRVQFADDPGLAEILYDIAREYRWVKKYDVAKNMYQQIIQQYPDTPAASRSQLGVSRLDALSLIRAGKDVEAHAAINGLIANFVDHSDIPETLYWLAKECEWVWDYDMARQLYQELQQRYAASSWVSKIDLPAQKLHVFSLIDSDEIEAAQVEVNGMISKYSSDSELPNELFWIARKYEDSKEYNQSKELFKRIIADFAQSAAADSARVHLAKMDVINFAQSGQLEEARAVAEDLMIDYEGNDSLPEAVLMVGEYLYWHGQELQNQDMEDEALAWFEKAQEVLEIVKSQWPSSGILPIVYRVSGHCYVLMGDNAKAAASFEKMISDYPEGKEIWLALFELAQCYEGLKGSGEIPESEADAKIKAAYKRILDEYSNCPVAEGVQQLLNR